MNLITIDLDSIRLGTPLPFTLRGTDGAMLASKGTVLRSRDDIDVLLARGISLCVDTDESGDSHRAYMAQLHKMLRAETSLGRIATAQLAADEMAAARRDENRLPDWLDFQLRTTNLLRSPNKTDFLNKFTRLEEELGELVHRSPDATLFALIFLSTDETQMYSATHSMLVSTVCAIAAREVLRWPAAKIHTLARAALSMNIGMTELQDQLAQQAKPLTSDQIDAIEQHHARSEQLLQSLGVTDPVWLEAVRRHHDRAPGPLSAKTEAEQIARLIQRADLFAARIAPRASRTPMATTAALQASYFDEEQRADEAGGALIKALGIYAPGSFVRLASNEVAMVVRRGPTATTPRVAVVINRQGMPTGEAIMRDTHQPAYKITANIAHREVKVKLTLDRLLPIIS
jgi:HD-GYP domain-containing protein (c-di-GMP phosphodiesterase class II)